MTGTHDLVQFEYTAAWSERLHMEGCCELCVCVCVREWVCFVRAMHLHVLHCRWTCARVFSSAFVCFKAVCVCVCARGSVRGQWRQPYRPPLSPADDSFYLCCLYLIFINIAKSLPPGSHRCSGLLARIHNSMLKGRKAVKVKNERHTCLT